MAAGGRFTMDLDWQAYVYGRAGQEEQARRALKKLQQLKGKREMDPAAILFAYIGMGDREQSFAWLEKACLQHSLRSSRSTIHCEVILGFRNCCGG
jgi:Flp pilus assembly protein TadD